MTKAKSKKLLISLMCGLFLAIGNQQGWFDSPQKILGTTRPGLYQVTKVFDGDTIEVNMNGAHEKIRLIGVDTPETHDPRKAVECYGRAASEFTTNLIGSNPVRLEADSLGTNRDRYNRLLRYVYLPDGRLVNKEVIANGYGFAYTSFPFAKMEEFRAAEQQARAANLGLWSSCPVNIDQRGFIHSGVDAGE